MRNVNPAFIVVIPSLNPDQHLIELVDSLSQNQLIQILVVDDGSAHQYQPIFDQIEQLDVIVLHHNANRGKGAALKTAFSYVLEHFPHVLGVVTADADGQHSVKDINALGNALVKYPKSLILGVRDFSLPTVPFKSRWGNRITAFVFLYITRESCKDTQTGLRAIPLSLLESATVIEGDRFEYEMNMLVGFVKSNIPLIQLPIDTIYRDNNNHSHFRAFKDSLRIYKQLLRTVLRFASSALIATIIDVVLFTLLYALFFKNIAFGIIYSTAIARVISGITNFFINARWSFDYIGRKRDVAFKYGLLFISLMAASSGLVTLLTFNWIHPTVVKVIVDSLLFNLSYIIQKRYIFTQKN